MLDLSRLVFTLLLTATGLAANAADSAEFRTREMLGEYSCSFTLDQGKERIEYPSFLCVIKGKKNSLQLDKTSGSQRIRGAITITEAGFSFEGTFFCPYGDCQSRAFGDFIRLRPGVFRGVINQSERPNDKIIVDLEKRK